MSVATGTSTDLQSLVRARIDAWRAGTQPDAAIVLAEHPELESNKSLVLDLVLEEYCLRSAAGDTLVKSTFCERFPAYRQSIVKMIEVQEFLDQCPQFARGSQGADWPEPGERFLGYDVVQLLGSGALARVYLAREPALGQRLVVIKVSRFGAAEAETLGKLSHPNIVPIHSVQHDSVTGWTAICMPLLGTATAVDLLDAAFAAGPPPSGEVIGRVALTARPIAEMPPPVAGEEAGQWRGPYADAIARLGLQLAEGLHKAHEAGIRHHDIKPSNVLLAWSGRPMLLDFNLSTDASATTERIGGTLPYMAPELIAGLVASRGRMALRLDPRSDIYSLGAVLYELLTGQLSARPSGADKLPSDAYQPWLRCKQLPPASLRSVNPAIDRRLEAIVLRCLAFDPAGRYVSAAELAAELRSYLSLPQAARRFVGRNRRGFLAAGAVFALTAGTATAYVTKLKPYPERKLEEGLLLYARGDYEEALEIFDHCVDLDRTSPAARFARGQTLRQLQRWDDARADFATLKDLNSGWSDALVGFCHMRAKNDPAAASKYALAYKAGVRNIRILLNHADVNRRRGQYHEATKLYTEVVQREPENAAARRGRAYCHLWSAVQRNNNKKLAPVQLDVQAFEDSRADVRLTDNAVEALFVAAQVFGCAVMIDPTLAECRSEGAGYLLLAFKNGLTQKSFKAVQLFLQPLIDAEIEALAERAPARETASTFEPMPQQELPHSPRWTAFLEEVGEVRQHVAHLGP